MARSDPMSMAGWQHYWNGYEERMNEEFRKPDRPPRKTGAPIVNLASIAMWLIATVLFLIVAWTAIRWLV